MKFQRKHPISRRPVHNHIVNVKDGGIIFVPNSYENTESKYEERKIALQNDEEAAEEEARRVDVPNWPVDG